MGTKKRPAKPPADKKTEKTAIPAEVTGVVVAHNLEKSPLAHLPLLRRVPYRWRLPVVILAAILIAALAVGVWRLSVSLIGPKQLDTPESAQNSLLNELQDSPPKANAPAVQKADYYRQLGFLQVNLKNYKAAAVAFKQWEAAAGTSIPYDNYMTIAGYYYAAGDKAAAQSALDKAVAALPTKENPQTGYYPSEARQEIEEMRLEYAK